MNEEIRKAIEELRAQIEARGNKDADASARVDQIEAGATARETIITELRAEIETVSKAVEERDNAIKEMQQKARVASTIVTADAQSRHNVEVFGMMIRSTMAGKLRQEVPTVFKEREETAITAWRDTVAPETRDGLPSSQRATLEAGATTGSYLVPTSLDAGSYFESVEEVSDLLGRVEFLPGLPGNVTVPYLLTRPTMQGSRATVDTAMSASSPTFGQMSLTPDEKYVYFPIDNRLLQMSALNLGSIAMDLLRDSLVGGLAGWIVLADGTSTYDSLTGILNEATYVTSMGAGKTSFGDVDNAALNAALGALHKQGRVRASYMMSLYVQGILEDIDRSGKSKIITHRDSGDPLCKMMPLVIEEAMPDKIDDAVDTGFMAVGDLAAMIVGLVGGIMVSTSTDYLFGKNQTAFRGVVNADIQRKPVNTLRTLKTAAV